MWWYSLTVIVPVSVQQFYSIGAFFQNNELVRQAEPVFASDLMKVLEKTGLPPVSLRTLQRDLKDIMEARRLYRNFSS